MGNLEYNNIFAQWDEKQLSFGNNTFKRTIDLSLNYPKTISIINLKNQEQYAANDKCNSDVWVIGLPRPTLPYVNYQNLKVTAKVVEKSIFDSEHIYIEVYFKDEFSNVEYVHEYFVYADIPAHGIRNRVKTPVIPQVYWNYRSLQEQFRNIHETEKLESCMDSIKLADGYLPCNSIEFISHTDLNDEQVKIHSLKNENFRCNGNIIFCENEKQSGFLYLQEAPSSAERRDFEKHDFRFENGEIFSCNWNLSPAEILPNIEYQSCRNAVILYSNKIEKNVAVKNYLKKRFPMDKKDYVSLVNPWGCGHFPKVISPEFLNKEIVAAAECGADAYQIDDAWQKGIGLIELINNKNIALDFWEVSQDRMNGSLEPQVQIAKEAKIDLALWIAPTNNIEYSDYKEFAKMILYYHKKYNINLFKVDAIYIRSYNSERNLENLFKIVREETNGKVFFNLDATAGQRPGYFMFLEYGNIFLENRYGCHQWGRKYHPEKSLRNFWRLNRFMLPQSLQIEITAPENVVEEYYKDENILAPNIYPFEYWAAITLFTNPLIWTAPSQISSDKRETLNKIMTIQKEIRDDIFAGNVFSIGDEPNGEAISGFFADCGYLLMFRENKSSQTNKKIILDFVANKYKNAKLISGNGDCVFNEDNSLNVTLPDTCSYALWKLS